MSIVLTSTTEPQENLDHAASDKWREAPEVKAKAEPVPEVEPAEEPVEAPEPPSEPDVPSEEPETEVETEAESKHKRGGVDKRIAKLTKESSVEKAARIAAEARAEAAERRIAELQGEGPARVPDFEPKLEDYEAQGKTRDDWVKDTMAYAREMAKLDQRGTQILKTGEKKYADWKELQNKIKANEIRLPDDVNLAVNKVLWDEETENPEDIIHHLWANPEDGKKLAGMPPDAASRFIVRLGARLAVPATNGNVEIKPKAKVVPPAPITPVTSSGTKTSTPLEKMSIHDFMKARNKEEIAKRKRF